MPRKVKIKIWGDDAQAILRVMDEVRNIYAPNVTQSELLESHGGGYHGFITVYMEAS